MATLLSTLSFFRGQLFQTPQVPKVELSGKTVLVTGANSGLGLDAAKILTRLNCSTIVLACRSLAKGEEAKQAVQSVTGSEGQRPTVVVLELDLGSFANVVTFADRCKDLPRLDAVILNAGVHLVEFSMAEGYETTITVNVISTFLLATLLVPTLRLNAKKYGITPNIAIVGSAVHFWAKDKDLTTPADGEILRDLSDPKKADMKGRYYLSKLPVMLLIKYLAIVLTKSAKEDPDKKPLVVINNVGPGLCKTNLFRHTDSFAQTFLLSFMGRESEVGARTLVHGAVAGKESNGQYLSECQVKKYSAFVRSSKGDQTADRLWQELSAIYEEVKSGCTKEL